MAVPGIDLMSLLPTSTQGLAVDELNNLCDQWLKRKLVVLRRKVGRKTKKKRKRRGGRGKDGGRSGARTTAPLPAPSAMAPVAAKTWEEWKEDVHLDEEDTVRLWEERLIYPDVQRVEIPEPLQGATRVQF